MSPTVYLQFPPSYSWTLSKLFPNHFWVFKHSFISSHCASLKKQRLSILLWNLFPPQGYKGTNALHGSKSINLSLSFPPLPPWWWEHFRIIFFTICSSENDRDHKVQGCSDMWADGISISCSHTAPQSLKLCLPVNSNCKSQMENWNVMEQDV